MNNALSKVLIFKILATLIAWCIPLMLFPTSWMVAAGFPAAEPILYTKLLGMAYLALLVGYAYGLKATLNAQDARPTVMMGIVSNLGASLIMLFYGLDGAWADWGPYAQVHMWLSTCSAFLISAGLAVFGLSKKDENSEASFSQ